MLRIALALIMVFTFVFIGHAANTYQEMHDAIAKNDISKVKALLNSKPKLNKTLDSRAAPTYLTQASRLGRTEIALLLIKSGANVDFPDGDGMTPLLHACQIGNLKIAEALIHAGADVNDPNKWGETPLMVAKNGNHKAIITVLIKAGAK